MKGKEEGGGEKGRREEQEGKGEKERRINSQM